MAIDPMSALFDFAGDSALAHLVLSQLLRALIGWRSDLAMELFAVPNSAIMPDWGFRLLRARYFLPWLPGPHALHSEPFKIRFVFFLTRMTGFAAPTTMLAFFAEAFYVAGR